MYSLRLFLALPCISVSSYLSSGQPRTWSTCFSPRSILDHFAGSKKKFFVLEFESLAFLLCFIYSLSCKEFWGKWVFSFQWHVKNFTVKTAVLLCELNRHITHVLRVLLQVHELMQCVLPEMRTQYGLIQHFLHTHLMCVQSMRESRINTL